MRHESGSSDDNRALLLAALGGHQPDLTGEGWSLLIALARQSGLLARLGHALDLENVPEAPRRHLINAGLEAERHRRDVLAEIDRIADALKPVCVPLLLKGAAYVAAELPPARGRLFSDFDVMVPADCLDQAENALMLAGWVAGPGNPYDDAYYRRWMHQLPPMRHLRRGTVVDLHHAIVPPTARHAVAGQPILDAACFALDGRVMVPSPEDMVVHSATHLLNEGEFAHGLRDLSDIDLLVRGFTAADAAFPQRLCWRAAELGQTMPVELALILPSSPPRKRGSMVGQTKRQDTMHSADGAMDSRFRGNDERGRGNDERGRWQRLIERTRIALFDLALHPPHASCRGWPTLVAQALLYVRGHLLRMPLRLLVPHLLRKALRRLTHAFAH
jgi:hypothetical protein